MFAKKLLSTKIVIFPVAPIGRLGVKLTESAQLILGMLMLIGESLYSTKILEKLLFNGLYFEFPL